MVIDISSFLNLGNNAPIIRAKIGEIIIYNLKGASKNNNELIPQVNITIT